MISSKTDLEISDAVSAAHRAVETVWRIESARVIAAITRQVGDVALAEDFAQDAVMQAIEKWPVEGVPRNPGAWLTTAARRRAIDHLRRAPMLDRTHSAIGNEMDTAARAHVESLDAHIDDPIGDERLGLMLMTCHPVLSAEARVALTLRLVGGLETAEIARAFLATESTIAQRIVRAKRTLTAARVPFEVPRGAPLDERIGSVLEVLYLIFNEGYSATAGEHLIRHELCDEAVRMGRIVARLAPESSEAHGLIALMEIQASRLRTRVGPTGEPVLLLDQDRSRWDWLLIGRGLEALDRAGQAAKASNIPLGPYALQASIAACHARARKASETDWTAIAALYDALAETVPSPVVELNRAMAVSMAYGAEQALPLVDALMDEARAGGALAEYHPLYTVRADLLERLGDMTEACVAYQEAAALTRNARERAWLLARASRCGELPPPAHRS